MRQIGALAKQTDTKVETIRFYERIGLLPTPARSSGGYRLYRTEHVKRLNFVRRARGLSFSIDEIRRLLRLADERKRGTDCPLIEALYRDQDAPDEASSPAHGRARRRGVRSRSQRL